MIPFIGNYECKIDAKNRLLIPVGLKKQLDVFANEGFIIKRAVNQPFLELYPMPEWMSLLQKLNKLNPMLKATQDYIRIFKAGEKEVDIDSSGRLLIAKDLINYAQLTKEIVLNTTTNKIEIWDKDIYEATLIETSLNYEALTEQVWGNININN